VNFELDSYWPTEAGVNALELDEKAGTQEMKAFTISMTVEQDCQNLP